jgi:hypothetical protein
MEYHGVKASHRSSHGHASETPRHSSRTRAPYRGHRSRTRAPYRDTREIIKDKIAKGVFKGSNSYYLGNWDGVAKYVKDYSTLATAGATGNLAVTYLGSYTLNYQVMAVVGNTALIAFTINNSSTIESATHPPVIGYGPWWSENIGNPLNNALSTGPMSKTTQTFQWTETIKLK